MPAPNVNWPTPLTRLNPWYPGQFGVPGTDSETGLRLNTEGCVFWVDPNHVDANDSRDGTNPNAPLATVAAALTHCEAYRGDTIAVMHNGYWTYGNPLAAHVTPILEAVTVSVPGVRLVGVSPSSLGVPWCPSAINVACITVQALDVVIEGFNFWDGLYTGTTGILAQWDGPPWGENVTIRHNYFYGLGYGVQLDYAWNSYIEDNTFYDMDTAAIHNPSVYGEPDYLVVRNNVFRSNPADINLPDTDSCLIENNRFLDVTAAIVLLAGDANTIHANTIQGAPGGTNNYINLTGGASNLVSGNWLACTIAQYDVTCSDATSGSWVGNFCTNGMTTAPPV
jgi:hypothetical protein